MEQFVNLLDPKVRANPYPFYAELRRQRVCRVEPGGMWAIGGYDDIVAALKDPKTFSSSAWEDQMHPPWLEHNPLGKSLGVMDPPHHTRLRALISRAFSPTAIARMEAWTLPIAERLANAVVPRQQVDYTVDFATPMAAGVICNMLGLDERLAPKMRQWAEDLTGIPTGFHTPEQIARTRATVADLQKYLTEVLEARRKEPREDLVTDLLHSQEGDTSLRDEEIISTLFALVAAGFDTTTILLTNTTLLLARFPHEFERVRANPALIPQFVEEVLRYEPTGHYIFRRVTKDTEVGGTRIPAGAMAVLVNAAALRDERYFSNPDEFIIERQERTNMAFGHGMHYCIGSSLARMEARVATKALLQRIRSIRLDQEEIDWGFTLLGRGPTRLRLRLEPS
jgi:hypothetical protein